MKTNEPLVKGHDVAKHLGISYPSLMAKVAAGEGPPHYLLNDPKISSGNVKKNKDGTPRRPRHLVRFKLSEVEDWLVNRRKAS